MNIKEKTFDDKVNPTIRKRMTKHSQEIDDLVNQRTEVSDNTYKGGSKSK